MSSVKRCSAVVMLLLLMLTTGTVSGQEQKPEMVVQMGHTFSINDIDVSNNGKYILTGSGSGSLRLWHLDTGKVIRTFSGHSTAIQSVDISPDGTLAVSGAYDYSPHDKTMILWDLNTGDELSSFGGYSENVNEVLFLPNGRRFLTASAKTITEWDVESENKQHSFSLQAGVSAIALSPDGTHLLIGCTDSQVKLWNLSEMREVKTFYGHSGNVVGVDFSPDGKTAVSCSWDNTVMIWNIESGELVKTIHHSQKDSAISKVLDVQFSPDGKKILSGSGDHTIKLWEAFSGRLLKTYDSKCNGEPLQFSPDGNHIFSVASNSVNVLETESGCLWNVLVGPANKIHSVAFARGNEVILTGSEDTTVKQWDGLRYQLVRTFRGHKDTIVSISTSRDNNSFFSGSVDGTAKLWEFNTGLPLQTVTHSKSIFGQDPIKSVVLLSNNNHAITGASPTGTVKLWDLDLGEEVKEFKGHLSGVEAVAVSSDEKTVLSGAIDKTLKLWDMISTRELCTFIGHTDMITSVAISRDGTMVLSGSHDQTVILWATKTVEELWKVEHTRWVSSVAFSPEGTKVLSGCYDNNVRLIDSSTGKIVRVFTGHSAPVLSVTFSPDGKAFLSGSSDGTMRIWNIETGEWVAFMANADGSEWLIFDSDGYWDASPQGGEMVAMVRGMECWNIDQFAVRNNRPDLILKKLPDADPELIGHYRNQYLRRLRRLGLAEEDLSKDYHVPSADIVESRQEGKYIDLRFVLEDKKVPLKSYNIYVNDVPIFGAYGRELDDAAAGGRTTLTERIELSAGENKIEVSCMNEAGAEAFRPVVYASYDGPVERDLYYIGFGVSEYRDESLDLRYAHKDAEDLGKLFGSIDHGPPRTGPGAGGGAYRRVIIRTYTDEEVTRENIAAAKSLLEQASVDDTVVLMISGHGIHDRDKYATYYYLTHETDLDNLAQTAVEFEELEELLQGIPPRQKLFLMDTCGSGEWDPETARKVARADEAAAEEGSAGKGVWSRMPSGLNERADGKMERNGGDAAVRGGGTDPRRGVVKEAGAARTYLSDKDRYIYNDLVRRSGAIVFSSCRGDEVSYESAEYENGLFTEYIIRGLWGGAAEGPGKSVDRGDGGPVSRPADADGDGVVTTEELRQYVRSGVAAETEEDPLLYAVPQHPTVDRDNIYVEFGF